jgi:trans-aconitate 2-methyltransferase
VPDHPTVLRQLLRALPSGGVLAVQMPDNTTEPALTLQREIARNGPWVKALAAPASARDDLPTVNNYYDLLRPVCARLDIWHTTYNHVMDGPGAIVEWFKGSSLRPYLSALEGEMRGGFLAAYTTAIGKAYPPRFDGKVLLRFPRLFIVAVR